MESQGRHCRLLPTPPIESRFMSNRVPNLFLIGAQKAGSTNLAAHLEQSPDIEYYGKKEPNVFSKGSLEACRRRISELAIGQPLVKFLLDASPDYSRHPSITGVAEFIRELAGKEEPRFLYSIRNPVDRMISHYFWSRQRYGESYDFEEAVERDPRYVEGSLYDLQIEQYLAHFPRERFRAVKFESFVRNPFEDSDEILRWIGAEVPGKYEPEPEFDAETDKKVSRKARLPFINRIVRGDPGLRRLALKVVSPENQLRLAKWLSKPVPRPAISLETRRRLLDRHFRKSIERTAQLTGLDLSDWQTAFERSGGSDKAGKAA